MFEVRIYRPSLINSKLFSHRKADLCLLLVAHGHHSQHQVDQVEGAEEDDDGEEDDVNGSSGGHHHVVDVLPVVERDQLEGGEHAPQQVVEAGEPVVGVLSNAVQAGVAVGTGPEERIWRVVLMLLLLNTQPNETQLAVVGSG